MRLFTFGIILAFLLPAVAFAQAPVCDVSCGPDPGSGTYAGTAAARPLLRNARGQSSSIVPRTSGSSTSSGTEPPWVGHPTDPNWPTPKQLSQLPGSESYNYDVPIASLPGRNGLDLNLTLHYSSRLWTVDSANGTATFNADRDFPSYGFRLDFGYIDTTGGTFVLTEADGSKRRMNLVAANSYDTDDSSYINYNSSSKILKYKNGTQVLYEVFPSSSALLRPKKITDTNGNYITIAYVTHVAGKPDDQRISTITDTLGRVITFTYDGSDRLISVTQGTKTYATFTWGTVALNYNFDPSLAVVDTQTSGTIINVLAGCRYANSTGYDFFYGDWGIVNRINRVGSTGNIRSYVTYNYPTAGTALLDAPTYTTQTVVNGASTSSWNYATVKVNGLVSSYTITDPVSTKTVFNLYTAGDWKDGMVSSVELRDSASTLLRTFANSWIADATTNRNARLSTVTTTLNDSGQQSKVEYTYTSSYGNVNLVKEYDYGLVLKRQTLIGFLGTTAYTTTYHILDRVNSVLVRDGSGAVFSKTTLAYDGTAVVHPPKLDGRGLGFC